MTKDRHPDPFAARSNADVARLIDEHPLAWVVSRDGENWRATLLPLLAVTDPEGQITRLVGHFARSNSHVEALKRSPEALILFLGPQGYISPSWIDDRTWAPTWNYVSAQFIADIEFFETGAKLDSLLRSLVRKMEQGHPRAWTSDEMGERYRKLTPHIIGFDAPVRTLKARFKLGQDERDATYRNIAAGLRQTGADDLLEWMTEFNPARLK